MRPDESPAPPIRLISAESVVVGMAGLLVLGPWLFVSSPQYREAGLLGFGLMAACVGWFIPDLRRAACDPFVRWVVTCLFVAQAASMTGGLRHGAPLANVLAHGFSGTIGALGLGVLTWVLLEPSWRPWVRRTILAVTILLATGSLVGHFVFTQWQEDLSKLSPYMDPRRLALVWPTRLVAGDLGRQYWAHANTAAFLFATAWVLVVEALFPKPRFAWIGWLLALILGAAVFLTASRSAWLMVLLTLPLLLVWRGWRFSIQVGVLLATAVFLGIAGLNWKGGAAGSRITAPAEVPEEIHLGGLIDRGSAGRSSGYHYLWDQLEGDRLFGHGLAVTRTPMIHLLHEHSTYLATLRGGGITALVAQLVLMGGAVMAALRLARTGCRWPLILTVVVFSGLLFDRSTVFRLTGFEEFPAFWFTVWIPLAMRIR